MSGFSPLILCSLTLSGTDWVDPEDPTVIAESELLTAAKSIEAAAQKLSQLKPRKKAKVGVPPQNHSKSVKKLNKNTHYINGFMESVYKMAKLDVPQQNN